MPKMRMFCLALAVTAATAPLGLLAASPASAATVGSPTTCHQEWLSPYEGADYLESTQVCTTESTASSCHQDWVRPYDGADYLEPTQVCTTTNYETSCHQEWVRPYDGADYLEPTQVCLTTVAPPTSEA